MNPIIGGTEMKRNRLNFLCVLVVGAMFVAAFTPIGFVGAPVGQQNNIYDMDAQQGPDIGGASSVVDASEVTGWIDGVMYGINVTNSSEVDLYVDGDDWGVTPDNWVKDGGYDGDTVMYFLDYTPTQYYLQISDYTSTFEEGGYEDHDTWFFDTQTNTDSGIGDTYLRGLMIHEIIPDPTPYVIIYDSGSDLDVAKLTDATMGYYLQKDDSIGHTTNGPSFDFSSAPSRVKQYGTTDYYYVDLNGVLSLGANDELKLVWNNPGTSADNIANGTDVIVDRVEWGIDNNFFSGPDPLVRDYDNTTMLNKIGSPTPGTDSYVRFPNGTDTDDCANDFIVATRTEPPAIGGMPGEPTELRVHRGGGAWGASVSDLVLNWTAPTSGIGNLVKNIVYYDSDLSNGFQYTTFQLFDPNHTGLGTEDGAELLGLLGDSNNYAFIVRTTGDAFQGGPNENPTNTNVGYKYGIDLQANIPPQTSQMFVSLPYYCDWTKASDIAGAGKEFDNGNIITAVLKWNYTTQIFDSRTWTGAPFNTWEPDDFPINPGDAIAVGVSTSSPYTWKIVGAYDDTFEFTFQANTPPTTSQMFTSIPYHTSYIMASDIAGAGKEFDNGDVITAVLQWNYTTQIFDSRTWTGAPFNTWEPDDFTIDPMPGGHLAFGISTSPPVPWQPQVMGL
jgi:hypothetical protein